ncbi:sensor histidine kinase [Paenibacillus sp. OAS669]|uniref:sensor histidine kinase n=1 Tax=Paenibacillus sp. OAS669 TaxID=2663821 RepID=UPI00178A554A|nr:sensor histidine kinase [Paenibacillus sp. OAS669]MBE1445542.1 sensor histidine kinase YesM [Paenibacillus sp. OAS669]
MTIRTKLLLFIPLLVLLANAVTFFVFQSEKIVQTSYDRMMHRMLQYKQSAQTAEQTLKSLYGYLLNPEGTDTTELERGQAELAAIREELSAQLPSSLQPSELTSYVHMLDTLKEQEQASLSSSLEHSPSMALSHYEEAESTLGFIREAGQALVDLELSSYQPAYQQLQVENNRLNRLGAAVFIVNTLLGIGLALWISGSITGPVRRLLRMAQRVSKGQLESASEAAPPRSEDELGILSDTFQQMMADLSVLIEKDKESLEKDRLVKELELKALQSQIQPHFLFNTLNVLSKLALIEGAEKTSDLIVSMSNLLRYNLSKLDQPVTLKDELDHLKEYIAIQQARFRDRVRFEMDIDASALSAPIPALTIQPLVENAFLHGIERMEQGAMIRIAVRWDAEGVCLAVEDNGAGMSEDVRQRLLHLEGNVRPAVGEASEQAKKPSTGLGTANVFKRLQLLYGRNDLVDIQSKPGEGTRILIRIPDRKESESNDVSSVDSR